jgi:hypothetical protein
VDKQYLVTMQLPDIVNGGGFRLLNMTGQHLWYIPGADVTKALDQLPNGGSPVLVASGQGTYGPASLYVNKDANNLNIYIYTGYDNFGKPNSFIFGSCIPQGADPSFSLTPSAVPSLSPSTVPTGTATAASSPTPSSTPTSGPSATPSDTPTDAPTFTPSNTPSDTPTFTPSNTPSDTPTFTSTSTPSDTPTFTPTSTPSDTPTFTPTNTPPVIP